MGDSGSVTLKAGPDHGAPWLVVPIPVGTNIGEFATHFKQIFGVTDVPGAAPKSLEVAAAEVAASFQAAWNLQRAQIGADAPGVAPPPAGPRPPQASYPAQQYRPAPPAAGPPPWAGAVRGQQAPAPAGGGQCSTCGAPMVRKEGVGKNGPYAGWVCSTRGCAEPARWDPR
jgi:hypothetical protein